MTAQRRNQKTSRADERIRASSGNVFADLGFDDAEAQVLALRADLMAQLDQTLKSRKLTQTAAAEVLGVSQGRVSDLTRGKIENFSLDMLVTFAARLGKPARITLAR
jgi:predicted XRE-type DNA-binding protein